MQKPLLLILVFATGGFVSGQDVTQSPAESRPHGRRPVDAPSVPESPAVQEVPRVPRVERPRQDIDGRAPVSRDPRFYGPPIQKTIDPLATEPSPRPPRPSGEHPVSTPAPTPGGIATRPLGGSDLTPAATPPPRSVPTATPHQWQHSSPGPSLGHATPPPNYRGGNRHHGSGDEGGFSVVWRNHDRTPHDPDWYRGRYNRIVLFSGGYYYFQNNYWFPAYGYTFDAGAYDNAVPVYAYNGLPPTKVVSIVQSRLHELGYYDGPVTGRLGAVTRQALVNFQHDAEIDETGAIDEDTLGALGLLDGD